MKKVKMRYTRKIIIALIIASGVIFAGITSYIIIFSTQKSFESKIRKLIAKYKIPSLAAGIVINNSLAWANGFGDQPDLDTVYMIGSITKTFTSTALLQLNENNKIGLDIDINAYLPFNVRNPDYPNISITTRMLLSHRSGLARDSLNFQIWYSDNETIEWMNENLGTHYKYWIHRPSLAEYLNGTLSPEGLYFNPGIWILEPGTQFFYSNIGYELLGYLVEQITNKTIEDYVQESILDPLNMASTGYDYLEFAGKNAIPYEWINGENTEFIISNMYTTGGSALRSTIPDMTNFMIAHMNLGMVNGTQILNSGALELMLEKHSSFTNATAGGFNLIGYGLGWMLYDDGLQGHDGAVIGYLASLFFKKTEKGVFGGIVMFNRGFIHKSDDVLKNIFFPTINKLIFEEAEHLFNLIS